jgi:ribosome-binding factor A
MAHPQYKRTERVAQVLKVELAQFLLHEFKDPRLGMITVSEVKLSTDMKHAKIYVAVHGGEEAEAEAIKILQGAAGFLRGQLGRRLYLRSIPELNFTVDRSLDHVFKIQKILKEVLPKEEEEP